MVARALDGAGNRPRGLGRWTSTLDLGAPATPAAVDVVAGAGDENTSPLFSGTVEAGASVQDLGGLGVRRVPRI